MSTEQQRLSVSEVHHKNLYNIAGKMIRDELKLSIINLPEERAALETLAYGKTEELLVQANSNHTQIQNYLSQTSAARAYYKRMVDMKEKLLLGDPTLQGGTKNKEQREYNMASDKEYSQLYQDLRTAETVVAYLEHLAAAAVETLQVIKKIRDAALARERWCNPQSYGQQQG